MRGAFAYFKHPAVFLCRPTAGTPSHTPSNSTSYACLCLYGRDFFSTWRLISENDNNNIRRGSRIFCKGGGATTAVYSGRASAPAPTGGLGLINIRLRYIASIKYSERFCFFIAMVKKFVEKEKLLVESRGGTTPPPPDPRLDIFVASSWPDRQDSPVHLPITNRTLVTLFMDIHCISHELRHK